MHRSRFDGTWFGPHYPVILGLVTLMALAVTAAGPHVGNALIYQTPSATTP